MAAPMARSSLMERRLIRGSKIDCQLVKSSERDSGYCIAEASPVTTTASTTPCPSHEGSPTRTPTEVEERSSSASSLQQRRRGNFRARPSINCDLVQRDQWSSDDPFANPQCQKLKDRYDGFEKLGEGSCGVVYKVRARSDNQEVAIKVMRMQDEELLRTAQQEYELLAHVCHPNIVRAIDFFTYPMGAVLVLEYFEGTKLDRAVREAPCRRLGEAAAARVFAQLLSALAHLHARGVVHRDVKADNILISHDLSEMRLVDFNAATFTAGGALTMTGTVDYMPPEVLQGQSPSEAGDVWAAGLCLHLMLAGRLPSERRSVCIRPESLDEAPAAPGTPLRLDGARWSGVSERCKEVLRQCLEARCDLRPPAAQLLDSPWLAEVA